MNSQPLQPFGTPNAAFSQLHISSGSIVTWLFYLVFAYWAIYTIVAIYHWIRYSRASHIAVPAIVVHILVSLALLGYIVSGSASAAALP